MNLQLSTGLAICALLSSLLLGCDNSESVQADTSHPKALQCVWKQAPPVDVIRFAGSDLVLTLGPDSVSIRVKSFTDVSTCIDTGGARLCSDFSWENTYRGTWTADDSLLTVSFSFTETTANPQTHNVKMPDGSYRMRYALHGPDLMTLSARSGDAPLPGRDSLDLLRE